MHRFGGISIFFVDGGNALGQFFVDTASMTTTTQTWFLYFNLFMFFFSVSLSYLRPLAFSKDTVICSKSTSLVAVGQHFLLPVFSISFAVKKKEKEN